MNDSPLVDTIRKALTAILLLGFTGSWVELLLLKHTDGFWQLVPVGLTMLATVVVIWCMISAAAVPVRILQGLSLVFMAAALVGVYQHFTGNVGYEKESNPGLAGAELYKAAMMGSTPLLAPGVMLQLALVGLLYTYRHPVLTRKES
jgi:hypothetical protein